MNGYFHWIGLAWDAWTQRASSMQREAAKQRSVMVVSLSTRSASTVARRKSRNGEEPIETVCYKRGTGLVVQVQMMTAGQLLMTEG
ncbi:hypothetical protein PBDP_4250 [Pseudomonas sp. St290]|nr:hypothetical protein PBDP_4250 [Pseudomonas sp. St290]